MQKTTHSAMSGFFCATHVVLCDSVGSYLQNMSLQTCCAIKQFVCAVFSSLMREVRWVLSRREIDVINFHPSVLRTSSLCQIGKNLGNYLKNIKKFVKIEMLTENREEFLWKRIY